MMRIEIPARYSRSVCVAADMRPEDTERFFARDELSALRKFRTAKRREEWGLSRIAAKLLAIDRQLCSDPKRCSVPPTDARPQLLVDAQPSPLFVSISHSGGRGAAAIDAAPIGIDLEKVRPIHRKALKLFLTEEEIAILETLEIENAALHFWCAKEAAWKLQTGVQTLKKVHLHEVMQQGGRLLMRFTGIPEGEVDSFVLDPMFIAAVATATESRVGEALSAER